MRGQIPKKNTAHTAYDCTELVVRLLRMRYGSLGLSAHMTACLAMSAAKVGDSMTVLDIPNKVHLIDGMMEVANIDLALSGLIRKSNRQR